MTGCGSTQPPSHGPGGREADHSPYPEPMLRQRETFCLFTFKTKGTARKPMLCGHGASSGCEWRRRPPDMKESCEYIE